MAGTKVRGIMDYLTALREKHKAVVAAAKAKATSRGKAQTQKFSPGGAAAAAAVAKGTQLRRGIRSSDAALAAALPPLAPVCAPGGAHQRGGSLSHAHALGGSGGSGSQKHAVPAAEKAIVFSQWTAMLDLLEPCLRAAEIKFRRLDGTMSLAARERALVGVRGQARGDRDFDVSESRGPRRELDVREPRAVVGRVVEPHRGGAGD
jgi:SNF2 family DNA or RNA helicase